MQTSNRAHFASSQSDERVRGAYGSHEDATTLQTHVRCEVFGGGAAQPSGKLHDAHIHLNACANADELAE